MFDVCGRRVKLATGKQTQTVNVCTQASVAGEYEYILRIRPPFATEHDLKSGWFSSIEQFVTHVQDRHGGELERGPGFPSAQQQTAVNVAYGSQDRESSRHVNTPSILLSSWTIAARDATERSIDR